MNLKSCWLKRKGLQTNPSSGQAPITSLHATQDPCLPLRGSVRPHNQHDCSSTPIEKAEAFHNAFRTYFMAVETLAAAPEDQYA